MLSVDKDSFMSLPICILLNFLFLAYCIGMTSSVMLKGMVRGTSLFCTQSCWENVEFLTVKADVGCRFFQGIS